MPAVFEVGPATGDGSGGDASGAAECDEEGGVFGAFAVFVIKAVGGGAGLAVHEFVGGVFDDEVVNEAGGVDG